jgi:hypothetical protein
MPPLTCLQFFQNYEATLVDPNVTGDFIVNGGIAFWQNINMTIKRRAPVKREI